MIGEAGERGSWQNLAMKFVPVCPEDIRCRWLFYRKSSDVHLGMATRIET
jgi:hypothetical protein